MMVTAEQAIVWITRWCAVLVLADSISKVYILKSCKAESVLSWQHLRTNNHFALRPRVMRNITDWVYSPSVWPGLLLLRGLSGLCLLIVPDALFSGVCLAFIFLVTSLINFWRYPFAAETFNRMMVVVVGALLLRSFVPDVLVTSVCLWFIALQSCFSYLTAGLAKLFNKGWRSGDGIYNIVTGANWTASGKISLFIIEHRWFGQVLNWITIIMECTFPLVLILPKPLFWFYIAWGFLFHAFNAVFLNLGKFFMAWVATYPAIIFIAQQ